MSNYTMYGYKTPKGIDSAIKVKDLQKKLGVSADGIWGPKTQAAYESKQSGSASLYGASAAKGLGDTALLSSKATRPYGAKAEGSSMLLEDSETRAQIASLRSMKETKPKKTDYGADSSTDYSANYSAAADAPAPSKTYTPPLNIRRPDQIRTMQRIMGVRDDGVWGPKTQAAYEAWHEKNTSSNYGETTIPSASQPQPFARESETPSLTPPLNIRRPDQIKTMQRIVGVKDDGIWGPKTQAAYEAWSERIKEREGESIPATDRQKNQVTTSDGWQDDSSSGFSDSTNVDAKQKKKAFESAASIIYKSSKTYKEKEALVEIIHMGASAGVDTLVLCAVAKGLITGSLAAAAPTAGIGTAIGLSAAVPALAKMTYDTTSKYAQFIAAIDNFVKDEEFTKTYYSRFNTGTYLDELLARHTEVN